jgi:hypothetical protein
MTERVKVEPSEIKVGDLIEVMTSNGLSEVDGHSGSWYRGIVTHAEPDFVKIDDYYSFQHTFNADFDREFYRLPKPVPVEPKGLGAVVELTDEEGDPRLIVRVHGWDLWQDEDGDEMNWDNWMVYSHNHAKVLHEGYNA